MRIEVFYSPQAGEVLQVALDVSAGMTIAQVLAHLPGEAPWPEAASGAQSGDLGLSLWSRRVGVDEVLRDGDRLELSRSLLVDPKVARRERFKGQGSKTAGLFSKKRPGAKAGY